MITHSNSAANASSFVYPKLNLSSACFFDFLSANKFKSETIKSSIESIAEPSTATEPLKSPAANFTSASKKAQAPAAMTALFSLCVHSCLFMRLNS